MAASNRDEVRYLGDVWKDYTRSVKPWGVQGFSGPSYFRSKKAAKAIGELFLKNQDIMNERQTIINA